MDSFNIPMQSMSGFLYDAKQSVCYVIHTFCGRCQAICDKNGPDSSCLHRYCICRIYPFTIRSSYSSPEPHDLPNKQPDHPKYTQCCKRLNHMPNPERMTRRKRLTGYRRCTSRDCRCDRSNTGSRAKRDDTDGRAMLV
jgi:hypothetical protein